MCPLIMVFPVGDSAHRASLTNFARSGLLSRLAFTRWSMLRRATVLEEIVRILPPEVAERVNKVVDSEHDQHAGIEQVLSRDGARGAG